MLALIVPFLCLVSIYTSAYFCGCLFIQNCDFVDGLEIEGGGKPPSPTGEYKLLLIGQSYQNALLDM